MTIEPLRGAHVEDAARLVLGAYQAERSAVDCLPMRDEYLELFCEGIRKLTDGAAGVESFAATQGGRLLGFLGGWPVERFFSSHCGVYVPLTAHGVVPEDSERVYQKLYEAASGRWVGGGRLTHCISFLAHDDGARDVWYWLGFGLRCVDSIRPLTPVAAENPMNLAIRKATDSDAEALFPLHRRHCAYYSRAPLFMPAVSLEDELEDFRAWLAAPDHHLWAAWRGGEPIAYVRITHGGETFVSDDPAMRNICGAYTDEEARGAGAGSLLLAVIVGWMREQGFQRLGTDFESFNIAGSRFWNRYFTPFQYSVVRSIDDRILQVRRDLPEEQ